MRLYSHQAITIFDQLSQGIYHPEWNHPQGCFGEDQHQFEDQYRFLRDEYNRRKGTTFTNPPLWWYTSLAQVKRYIKDMTHGVLIFADIPDQYILQYDSEDWYFPLWNRSLGFSYKADEVDEEVWEAYRRCPKACQETWKEIFNLPLWKRHTREIHAITMEIRKEWITQA